MRHEICSKYEYVSYAADGIVLAHNGGNHVRYIISKRKTLGTSASLEKTETRWIIIFTKLWVFFTHVLLLHGTVVHDNGWKMGPLFLTHIYYVSSSCEYFLLVYLIMVWDWNMQCTYNVRGSVHRNNILIYIYIYIYIQQDAHVTEFILSDNCSTCFGHHQHPSSGAQNNCNYSIW